MLSSGSVIHPVDSVIHFLNNWCLEIRIDGCFGLSRRGQTYTVKPLLSGLPIKWTPSIKWTLRWVPKRMSDISLYDEPLFSGHLYQADADTNICCIWLISIVKNLY